MGVRATGLQSDRHVEFGFLGTGIIANFIVGGTESSERERLKILVKVGVFISTLCEYITRYPISPTAFLGSPFKKPASPPVVKQELVRQWSELKSRGALISNRAKELLSSSANAAPLTV